ncbi:unknown protein [Seminavis robusta]|uniref:Uncharacterized protein n=1 Tax=Seminavis robusta TaxID=568900 RepID=A0A9N8F0G0_9STRA|nr:unknown protein [Seminavis robusta]|eukprot:Sro2146_g316441.1  (109) ;mRNA; f:14297-14623
MKTLPPRKLHELTLHGCLPVPQYWKKDFKSTGATFDCVSIIGGRTDARGSLHRPCRPKFLELRRLICKDPKGTILLALDTDRQKSQQKVHNKGSPQALSHFPKDHEMA